MEPDNGCLPTGNKTITRPKTPLHAAKTWSTGTQKKVNSNRLVVEHRMIKALSLVKDREIYTTIGSSHTNRYKHDSNKKRSGTFYFHSENEATWIEVLENSKNISTSP